MPELDLTAYRATYDPEAWARVIEQYPTTDARTQLLVPACLAIRALCDEMERLRLVLAAEQGSEGLEGWDYGGCGWYRGMSAIMRRQAIRAEHGIVTYWELMCEGYHVSDYGCALEAMEAMEAHDPPEVRDA